MSKVFFVGCGPGDPDLITIKAKKLLQKADVVIYSGSLIPPQILKMCKKAKTYDAAKLVREEIFDILKKNAKKGKNVVRLHDGDPTIYGAIREQMDNLSKEKIDSEIIPGVTSFLASAAALGAYTSRCYTNYDHNKSGKTYKGSKTRKNFRACKTWSYHDLLS